jgi:hypothetical protein
MEPVPPDVEPQMPTPDVQPSKPPRQGVVRRTVVVVLAVVGLLCLGGGAAAFLYYDRATQPDLRTPVVVSLEYLRAYLVDRDDTKAAQFACGGHASLKDIASFRDDVDNRQRTYGVAITVSVDGVFETARSGSTATTSADLALTTTIQGQPQRAVEHWSFGLRNEGGWRVCEGHEVT